MIWFLLGLMFLEGALVTFIGASVLYRGWRRLLIGLTWFVTVPVLGIYLLYKHKTQLLQMQQTLETVRQLVSYQDTVQQLMVQNVENEKVEEIIGEDAFNEQR